MNTRPNSPTSWPALLSAYFAIYVIWGTTYLAVAYALKGLGPFVISALRYCIAGLVLCCWLWFRKTTWPRGKDIRVLIISGVLMLSGGSGLVVVGEKYINSGFAAVLVATEPLFFVLFDRKRWRLYLGNGRIIAGLLMGFAGIILFTCFAPSASAGNASALMPGVVITLLSAMCWVAGSLYTRAHLSEQTSNLPGSAMQLLAAGIFSGGVALFDGEWSSVSLHSVPGASWAGLLYLIVMGSLVAYVSFNWLIKVQPPAIVSTHTYVNPVVALLTGWLLAGEPVSVSQLLALGLVLGGVILAQMNRLKLAA